MSDARARRSAIGVQPIDLTYNTDALYDVSMGTPADQYAALVAMIEGQEAAFPAPYTNTPPYGEPTPVQELMPESVIDGAYKPAADLQGYTDDELLPIISDAYPSDFPAPEWENDPQYFGLGVPPGVPAWDQPIESGHTQIIVPNPAAEVGWDEWSGKPKLARVARHENDFKGYGKGASRGHMIDVRALQGKDSAVYFTQQQRDLMLSELQKRGIHNVVVQDVPAQTYTDQVTWVDPANSNAQEYPFTEAGVL